MRQSIESSLIVEKAARQRSQAGVESTVQGALTPRQASVLQMQQTQGNAAVRRMLAQPSSRTANTVQRGFWDDVINGVSDALGITRTVTVGSQRVEVTSEDEVKEATDIIEFIKFSYSIDLDSGAGLGAIKKDYDKVPKAVTDKLETRSWTMKELRALKRALGHYAPILGLNRELSTRAGTDQEVTSVSAVDQAIDENSATGALDGSSTKPTLGEFFASSKNFSLFKPLLSSTTDFSGPDANDKEIEGTTVHEIAHGLLSYALPTYQSKLKYWKDANTADADPKTRVANDNTVEAPITFYGGTNASEDMSETALFYFVEPETLKNGKGKPTGTPGNPAPLRYAAFDEIVKAWKPEPKMPEYNDAPEPESDTAFA